MQDEGLMTPPSMGEMGMSMGSVDDAPEQTYDFKDVAANQIGAHVRTGAVFS